jgi:hypothetical protein
MNTPGFTAEASLGATTDNYALTVWHTAEQGRVVAQMRIGGGGLGPGGPVRSGFWSCLACVGLCSLITGDPEGCLVACQSSGACDVVAFSRYW